MDQALAGLKVLDFTTTIAGPHCTRMLADLGAEVIKVESGDGDLMRTRPPLRAGASALFGHLNAGKKSLVLDLKSPAAATVLEALIGQADVLVENFRPGVMARLGYDFTRAAAINPRLIYCSISGYGQTGPAAEQPAYAPTIHAASGFDLANMSYQPDRTRPDNCGIYVADIVAGAYAFGAIGVALHQRARTGRGQHLDVSMLEAMLTLTLTELVSAEFEMPPPPKRPIFGPVATADGFIMLAVASERSFQGLARAAGHPEWITDPRFAVYIDRRHNWGELIDAFEVWSKTLSADACLAALNEAGVPASKYRTVREALADPQLAHREARAVVSDAAGGFQVLNVPFRMSDSARRPGPHIAALGEHTGEVLRNIKKS